MRKATRIALFTLGFIIFSVSLYVICWAVGFATVGFIVNGADRICPRKSTRSDCVFTHTLTYPSIGFSEFVFLCAIAAVAYWIVMLIRLRSRVLDVNEHTTLLRT